MLKESNVVIIGTDHQAAHLFTMLVRTDGYRVLKIIDPSALDPDNLRQLEIDIIINTSNIPEVESWLRSLGLTDTNIMNGHCAQLLFCTGLEELRQGDYSSYREKVIQSLHEIKRTLYFTTRKEELLKTVLDLARRTLDADSGSIMLLNRQKRYLTIEMADGLENTIVKKTVQKLGTGIAGSVAKTGKARIIHDNERQTTGGNGARKDLVCSMSAPLVIGEKVVGVININSKRAKRVFNSGDLHHLKRLADFTADIIQTSKEYECQSAFAFCRSVEDGIEDILMMEQFPFLERISLLLLRIANTCGCEICNFYRFDRENSEFILKASSAISRNLSKYKKIKLNQRFTERITGDGNGFSLQIETAPGKKKWYLAEPVRIEGEIFGLVFLHKICNSPDLEQEAQILKGTAASISERIKTISQEERAKLETIRYSAMSELAFELASARDVKHLLKLIISNASLILGAETSFFSLYDEKKGVFNVSEVFSLSSTLQSDTILKINRVITSRASKTGEEVLVINEFDDFFPELSNLPTRPRSALSKCFSFNGKIVGALTLLNKNDADLFNRRAFNLQDSTFFSQFCRHALQALSSLLNQKAAHSANPEFIH
ncbi:MAG: GAF domain-containing protein [Fibrobacterota bacterium]